MGFSVFPSSKFNNYKSSIVRHTANSTQNLSIVSGTNMAYAILFSGGSSTGALGNIAVGLTPVANSITIGAGSNGAGGSTIYGTIMTGTTSNFTNNTAIVPQPRTNVGDGRFANDGLSSNPGAASASGNGAGVIIY